MANLLKTIRYTKQSRQISKSIILFGLFTAIFFCCEAKAQFDGGTGEPENPYRIATAEQLISIRSDPILLEKHYVLVNDIDLDPNLPGGQIFTRAVIAPRIRETPYPEIPDFNGSFNGNGYRIKHLTIRNNTGHMLGLFGKTGEEAKILDLGLENVSIEVDGSSCVGALSGLNHGHITNCYSNGKISSINRSGILGGLVGENHGGNITKCYADFEVSGEQGDIIKSDYLGGIVGMNWFFGRISNCYASGAVTGDHMVGGLVGSNMQADISNCYAIGSVSGGASIGGLAGYNGQYSTIINCFAIGHISAVGESDGVGGFVGGNGEKAIITGCFWDIEKSGVQTSEGGKGLTTAEMMDIRTYITNGWDFIGERANGTAGLWQMPESTGYPQLTVFSDLYQPPSLAGNGTLEYPYRIATAEDLGAVCHYDPSACYRLMTDIDLSGIKWTSAPIWYFNGRFDGNGCVMSNMTINGGGHLGLFGILDKHAIVKNLGVANANIVGREYGSYFGVLAARNSGDINGCYATGTICGQKNSVYIGGMVGSNTGTLSNCYTNGSVAGGHTIGGLAGESFDGIFANCYTTNSIAGEVEGLDIPPRPILGCLIGNYRSCTINSCYFLKKPDNIGVGEGAGSPLTDEQMKQEDSFVDWDFKNIWSICKGIDYPHLQWEQRQCEE